MYLILCVPEDPCGRWLDEGLSNAGLETLIVSPAELAAGRNWRHHVDDESWFEVTLPDGRSLDSRGVEGTINRTHMMIPPQIGVGSEADRSYAEQEFAAFALSVLQSLQTPLLNPPSPQGLCGAHKHPSELVWHAAQAGLPTLPYVYDTQAEGHSSAGWTPLVPYGTPVETSFVVGEEVIGPVIAGHRQGCSELARTLGLPLIGVDFLPLSDGGSAFVDASPCPDLTKGGPEMIQALARTLQAHGSSPS